MSHDFKKLKVWEIGMQISKRSFEVTASFPADEKFGLASQINRCCVSIPSNIAEGSSRTNKSFSHFIDIALGSSFELNTQMLIALDRDYLSEKTCYEIENLILEFQKMAKSFKYKLNN